MRGVVGVVLLVGLLLPACQGRGDRAEPSSRPTNGASSPTPAVDTPSPTPSASGDPAQAAARCTLVLGFSVTRNWFEDGAFETLPGIEDSEWELIYEAGYDVWLYADPSGTPYSLPAVSPCDDEPDRVVFQVAARGWQHRSNDELLAAIRSTIANIQATWPTVEVVELIPIVGGPDAAPCEAASQPGRPVDASLMNPAMTAAISQVVDGGAVVAGPDPLLADCSQYADGLGHISVDGSRHVASVLADHYGT